MQISCINEERYGKKKILCQLGASQQQILQVQLNAMNAQQTSGCYKIDLQHRFDITQKLVEREIGAGFGDYQVKLLFYLQSLKTKHQLGQITLNLAYYPNANINHIQEKKYMSGTTDKRAALYFELNLTDNSECDKFSNHSQGGSDIVVMHEINQIPQARNQSIEREVHPRLKMNTQENFESSTKKPVTQRIDRNNKLTSSQTAKQFQEDLQQEQNYQKKINLISTRTKSRLGQPVNKLKSPSRKASKSIDRIPLSSGFTKKFDEDQNRLKSSQKGQIKPRTKSPTPQPMPNKLPYPTAIEQNDNNNHTNNFTFHLQNQHQEKMELIQREEEDLYDQLNLIDRRIDKTIRVEHIPRNDSALNQKDLNSLSDRSPLELEMQRTINQQLAEIEKLRDQLQTITPVSSNQDVERFKNIVKELSSKMNIKRQELEKANEINQKLTEENQKIKEELSIVTQDKQVCKDIIEKLRVEVDEVSNNNRKLIIDNNNLTQKVDELTRLNTQSSASSLTNQQTSSNIKDLQMEISLIKTQLSEQQQKNRLLSQQNEQLQRATDQNKGLLSSSSILDNEQQLKNCRYDLELSVAECNKLKACKFIKKYMILELQSQINQCQNQLDTIKKYQQEMNQQDQAMMNMEGEMVKIKQQMAEYLNAAFEMGGADLVDLIEQKVNAMDS